MSSEDIYSEASSRFNIHGVKQKDVGQRSNEDASKTTGSHPTCGMGCGSRLSARFSFASVFPSHHSMTGHQV